MKTYLVIILLSLYPKKFRQKFREQILDIFDQQKHIDLNELLISILKENMKRLSSFAALVLATPVTFFVLANLYFYSLLHSDIPQSIDSVIANFRSPALIIGSLFASILLSTYAMADFDLKRSGKSVQLTVTNRATNTLSISSLVVAISMTSLIFLYLLVENIGF